MLLVKGNFSFLFETTGLKFSGGFQFSKKNNFVRRNYSKWVINNHGLTGYKTKLYTPWLLLMHWSLTMQLQRDFSNHLEIWGGFCLVLFCIHVYEAINCTSYQLRANNRSSLRKFNPKQLVVSKFMWLLTRCEKTRSVPGHLTWKNSIIRLQNQKYNQISKRWNGTNYLFLFLTFSSCWTVCVAGIINPKQPKDTPKSFTFDYSYWSHSTVSLSPHHRIKHLSAPAEFFTHTHMYFLISLIETSDNTHTHRNVLFESESVSCVSKYFYFIYLTHGGISVLNNRLLNTFGSPVISCPNDVLISALLGGGPMFCVSETGVFGHRRRNAASCLRRLQCLYLCVRTNRRGKILHDDGQAGTRAAGHHPTGETGETWRHPSSGLGFNCIPNYSPLWLITYLFSCLITCILGYCLHTTYSVPCVLSHSLACIPKYMRIYLLIYLHACSHTFLLTWWLTCLLFCVLTHSVVHLLAYMFAY